ncbi:hypothetical protein COU54_01350 [Candidatus Pacearchaeota archaeon CG10_big_fil_rev_8_21_14_0_10_31_24]|nr:MAG: hypothetical protein COU54_01350 [Candidatus Pacearchaeota archaeon CG10_big_fil_rev_8_21_14_0_10_31_24]
MGLNTRLLDLYHRLYNIYHFNLSNSYLIKEQISYFTAKELQTKFIYNDTATTIFEFTCKHNEIFELAIYILHNIPGINPNIYVGNDSPLHNSISENSYTLSKELIEYGANVNACSLSYLTTPLIIAVIYKHFDLVKLLVKNGADIHLKLKGVGFYSAYEHSDADIYQDIKPYFDKHFFTTKSATKRAPYISVNLINSENKI